MSIMTDSGNSMSGPWYNLAYYYKKTTGFRMFGPASLSGNWRTIGYKSVPIA